MWNADVAGARQRKEAGGYVRPFACIRRQGDVSHIGISERLAAVLEMAKTDVVGEPCPPAALRFLATTINTDARKTCYTDTSNRTRP
jgi:hypothetical protein